MYFAIGGRKTTSGLYRVTYTGPESTAPSTGPIAGAELRALLRRSLEAFHGHADPKAVDAVWPYLSQPRPLHQDGRRVALEFQDPKHLAGKGPGRDRPAGRARGAARPDPGLRERPGAPRSGRPAARIRSWKARSSDAMGKLDWENLPYARKARYASARRGPLQPLRSRPMRNDRPHRRRCSTNRYPAKGRELNVELCNLMVYLKAPSVARPRRWPLIEKAPTQEEQIDVGPGRSGPLAVGWTPELRKAYFSWIARAGEFKGGPSIGGFLKQIKDAALATLTESEKADLKPILEAPPRPKDRGRGLGRANSGVRQVVDGGRAGAGIVEAGLKQKRDFDKGRALFAAANCFSCHRYDNEGAAVGPDLTAVSGRFGPETCSSRSSCPAR